MSRIIRVVLVLVLVGCAQNVTSFAPNGLQSTTPNAGATRAKPNDEVVVHVAFKYENKQPGQRHSEFTIYTSYNHEPWFVRTRECVKPGDTVLTDVYYREPNKVQQIKFSAEVATNYIFKCDPIRVGYRSLAFHSIDLEGGSAHFHVTYDVVNQVVHGRPEGHFKLCAIGGGWNERCDDREQ